MRSEKPKSGYLGCGQGHTTRMLAEQFPNAAATGFEYEAALVAQASADLSNPHRIAFQQGDASRLPFPSASFDLVFTRYMFAPRAGPADGNPRDVPCHPAGRIRSGL
jgi:trans-aconitate methyltransferase